MPRYKLTIEFLGTNFSGWQIQPDALTVEKVLEDAFTTVLQQPIDLIGQGRTDAGVHASGQVAHVDLPKRTNIGKLIHRVNKLSGKEVQVLEVEPVSDEFHSRFDATSREYEYKLTLRHHPLMEPFAWQVKKELDLELLNTCAELLLGSWDFAGFSKFNEDNFTTICEVHYSKFIQDGDLVTYQVQANRFLRNMVRRLVGTMVEVAKGKMSLDDFEAILKDPEVEKPTYTAPAKGLTLVRVFY